MFDSATRKALVISIVGGAILLYVVEPLLRYMPSIVLQVVGAISQGWTDTIFRDAAQPKPTEALSILALSLLVVAVAILLVAPGQPHGQGLPPSTVFPFAVIIGLALLAFSLIRDTSADLAHCFHFRVTVLAPHLSDRETKELSASWTLMRSRADYDAIRGRLKEYAEKYNVVPVIKSLEATQQGRGCI